MSTRARVLLLVLSAVWVGAMGSAVATGCGGVVTIVVRSDAMLPEDGGASGQDVRIDADTPCSIERIYEPGELACCDDKLCRGNCTDAGICDCGGIAGGCKLGSVCCRGACVGNARYLCEQNLRDYPTEPCDGSAIEQCCLGKPCRGYCTSFRDAAPVCTCFDVIGGCGPSQWCCAYPQTRRCIASPLLCGF